MGRQSRRAADLTDCFAVCSLRQPSLRPTEISSQGSVSRSRRHSESGPHLAPPRPTPPRAAPVNVQSHRKAFTAISAGEELPGDSAPVPVCHLQAGRPWGPGAFLSTVCSSSRRGVARLRVRLRAAARRSSSSPHLSPRGLRPCQSNASCCLPKIYRARKTVLAAFHRVSSSRGIASRPYHREAYRLGLPVMGFRATPP